MNDGLINARKRLQEMRASGEPLTFNPIQKAANNPNSRSLAIAAKCFECVGGSANSSPELWRYEIQCCTSTTCPLLPWRPYK